jgi:hypothetical protein
MARKGKIMAHTDKLLSLVDQFPQAFSEVMKPLTPPAVEDSFRALPEPGTQAGTEPVVSIDQPESERSDDLTSSRYVVPPHTNSEPEQADDTHPSQDIDHQKVMSRQKTIRQNQPLQPHFLALMQEFPHAFADPSETTQLSTSSATTAISPPSAEASVVSEQLNTAEQPLALSLSAAGDGTPVSTTPAGDYDQALQRHISTFTWGEVQIYLTYNHQGLRSIWVTVGKSGTEVQSLCEAIARLINLLLSKQVPIPEICHQIRGIRGADSEGLGPNRILGLADLVGKALHEAPVRLSPVSTADTTKIVAHNIDQKRPDTLASESIGLDSSPETTETSTTGYASSSTPLSEESMHPSPALGTAQTAAKWAIPDQENLTAMLCPECSAELHHMNGCSGGACPVCGYSSCS